MLVSFSYFYLWKHRRRLETSPRLKSTYGSLYSNIYTKKRPAIRNIVVFFVRRIIVGFFIVFEAERPSIAFMIYAYSSIAVLSYLMVVKPLWNPV